MPKFRKKPVEIEAVQWTGENTNDVLTFVLDKGGYTEVLSPTGNIWISTLEGMIYASPDDWIIKGIAGEFYPCKPDIFEQTYERVDGIEG